MFLQNRRTSVQGIQVSVTSDLTLSKPILITLVLRISSWNGARPNHDISSEFQPVQDIIYD
jgi:hypothetical protein